MDPDLLIAAIAQMQPVEISAPAHEKLPSLGLRLLSDARASEEYGLWGAVDRSDLATAARLIERQIPVEATFDAGRHHVVFDSLLVRTCRPWLGAPRILLAWPARLRVVNRRSAPRELLAHEESVQVRLLRPADYSDRSVRLQDLSETGARLRLACDFAEAPGVGTMLEIGIQMSDLSVRLKAIVRNAQPAEGGSCIGLEFGRCSYNRRSAAELACIVAELRDRRVRRSIRSSILTPNA